MQQARFEAAPLYSSLFLQTWWTARYFLPENNLFPGISNQRSNSLLSQLTLCSQWCWRCKECVSWAPYFYGSYRMQLRDLSSRNCVLVSPTQLWKFTRSHLQSGLGGKKSQTICELHSFFSSDCTDLLSNGEDLALRESETESSFRHWNLNIPISQQAGGIHWGCAHRGPEGNLCMLATSSGHPG